jgi:mRNA interferase MazF
MSVRRGEVYFVDLNPTSGREQAGRRPVLVVSNDTLNARPLVVAVVPGTSGHHVPADYPGNVRGAAGEANLPQETIFMTFQIRALDPNRFSGRPVGQLGAQRMTEVDEALAWSLGLQRLT